MKIAIDCDGVLANFTEAYVRVANRRFPGRFPDGYVPDHWDFDISRMTKEEADEVWSLIKNTPNFWLTLKPYRDSISAFAKFLVMAPSVDVYIVTSRVDTRGGSIPYQTRQWLTMCGIHSAYNYLGVIQSPHASDKKKLYKLLGFDYSIDDKDTTVAECDTLTEHKAFLLDRPWNQDTKVKRRVASLTEFFNATQADIQSQYTQPKGTE